MSGNRANASARSRRAGGAELNPPQQQQQQQRAGQPPQRGGPQQRGQPQQPTPKLSISDAIGLITLRLGKVEGIIQNIQVDQLRQGDGNLELDENSRIIDDGVFKSIVSRLDVLEKNQKALMDNQTTLSTSIKAVAARTSTGNASATQTIVKDVSDEKLIVVNKNISTLREEMSQVKDMLMRLQNFTMETNQKLAGIVFEQSKEEDAFDDNGDFEDEYYEEGFTSIQVLEDMTAHQELSSLEAMYDDEQIPINLSELLKNDLSNINISGNLEEISQDL